MSEKLAKIAGPKLILRPVVSEDLPFFVEMMEDGALAAFTGTYGGRFTLREEEEYFEPSPEKVQFAVTMGGELLGLVEFMALDEISRSAEVGISIAHEHRNMGVGREALTLILDYGFSVLNLQMIYLTAVEENQRGIHLYESLGFQRAGKLRRRRYLAGYRNVIYMDLLREEWSAGPVAKQLHRILSEPKREYL
ncbi:MAG: GNAT family protein [Tissierellia bacterium]|nr:GNAT family protein [Tissierellia bacterium]